MGFVVGERGVDGVGVGDEDVAELVFQASHGDLDGGAGGLVLVVGECGGGHGPLDFIDGVEVEIHLFAVAVEYHLLAGFL